jgi:hypothetical protein
MKSEFYLTIIHEGCWSVVLNRDIDETRVALC